MRFEHEAEDVEDGPFLNSSIYDYIDDVSDSVVG